MNEAGKVLITRRAVGIYSMQVCCSIDATDKEILEVCNQSNPSGTINGWTNVDRNNYHPCPDYPHRYHFLVDC